MVEKEKASCEKSFFGESIYSHKELKTQKDYSLSNGEKEFNS